MGAGKPGLLPYLTVPSHLWRSFSFLSPQFHPMPWPSCNYKFQSVQTPHVKKGTPCPFPDTHPDLWAVTNTFWVPSFLAVHEGWPRVSNGRLPAPSVTTSWTLPARAAPCLRSRGQRALPAHTPCAGRLLPENAGELGVGERGDGDSSSTSLGLRRLHPHPGGAGPWELQARWRHRAVRTRIGQRAPCAPSPTGRCGESLLRISGLCLGSPASPRRPEPRSGRREGTGRDPAPESLSSEPGPEGTSPQNRPSRGGRQRVSARRRSVFKDLNATPNISW